MISNINKAFLHLKKRAESQDTSTLVKTFVDSGPLASLLTTTDHQVVLGRRGTGKTHALQYLTGYVVNKKDLPVYLDLRNIGSSGSVYSDQNLPLTERGTRLLCDVLTAIHATLLDFATTSATVPDLTEAGKTLDDFASEIVRTEVVGTVEVDSSLRTQNTSSANLGGRAVLSMRPSASLSSSTEEGATSSSEEREKWTGVRAHHLKFGAIASLLEKSIKQLGITRLWLLLDEWSHVPVDLQPLLADLIRRVVLPVRGITTKIAAVEHRSQFRVTKAGGEYLGVELGADVTADANLDDFMVFENDANKAIDFFRDLIFRHLAAAMNELKVSPVPATPDEMITQGFTQINAFRELVRASEGVPRDAMNVLSLAAQKADAELISVTHVRAAAQAWYQRDKRKNIASSERAEKLLNWIISQVIGVRQTRAFLLDSETKSPIINALFDERVIHILKKTSSSQEAPGKRFVTYGLDYGCYVDLLSTAKAPKGLLSIEDASQAVEYIEVPVDDLRSIRRAVLRLDEFENSLIR